MCSCGCHRQQNRSNSVCCSCDCDFEKLKYFTDRKIASWEDSSREEVEHVFKTPQIRKLEDASLAQAKQEKNLPKPNVTQHKEKVKETLVLESAGSQLSLLQFIGDNRGNVTAVTGHNPDITILEK